MRDIFEQVAQEHADIFPKATLETQIEKLGEEYQEWLQAETDEQELKELADCAICLAGVYRFSNDVGNFIYNLLPFDFFHAVRLTKEINRKWKVNKKRQWHYDEKTGKYKHVGKDGNE